MTEADDSNATRFADGRLATAAKCIVAGVCLAGSVPPWGSWPLAFIGIAITDRLLAVRSAQQRFWRMWVVGVSWLAPAMLWMYDLTPPGYPIAFIAYAAYFGVAAALTPPDNTWRRLLLPGTLTLAEIVRWYWPFGGVPLANLALSQVDTPLAQTARLAGPLLVMVLIIVVGQALSSAVDRAVRPTLIALGVVAVAIVAAYAHPRASVVREVETASVQGGGPTRTRASSDQQPVVLGRHVEATKFIDRPVDLILWPENVVNPGVYLPIESARATVDEVARSQDATVLAGWFYPVSNTGTVNYQSAITPDGNEIDRYDKVRIVPFGEFVPLRGFIEWTGLGEGIPSRDVIVGTADPVLDTPVGPVGVSISWEGFFERRARASVADGAELLTNPTNGASYWLTQVHTQQVASNQLRAIENDRWVLMVGPTGMSAVVEPDGTLQQRTDIGERAVLYATVEMRTGRTLASLVGLWPVLCYGVTAVMLGLWQLRRPAQPTLDPTVEHDHPGAAS
ncbi:MAG: apolipoprotein N-acyltransferase [Acidimicrobiales bacterium]